MEEWINEALNIRYVKLHFELGIMEDTLMPKNKVSAIRGGMGEMLLRANCVRNRKCEQCDFEKECIVRNTMYSQFENKPKFVTTGESIGYVLECEDYNEKFQAGSVLKFNIIVFGKTIVYINQLIQAVSVLGMEGLGRSYSKFVINNITNTKKKPLGKSGQIYKANYEITTISEYVAERMKRGGNPKRLVWHTPATIKYGGEVLEEFFPEAIFAAIDRRLYMLDSYENINIGKNDMSEHLPKMLSQHARPVSVRRYSSTHKEGIYLAGISGIVDFDDIDECAYKMLYAGELMHIGKNTSFGFGHYTMIERSF